MLQSVINLAETESYIKMIGCILHGIEHFSVVAPRISDTRRMVSIYFLPFYFVLFGQSNINYL